MRRIFTVGFISLVALFGGLMVVQLIPAADAQSPAVAEWEYAWAWIYADNAANVVLPDAAPGPLNQFGEFAVGRGSPNVAQFRNQLPGGAEVAPAIVGGYLNNRPLLFNWLGSQGWELVAYERSSTGPTVAIFKRQKRR